MQGFEYASYWIWDTDSPSAGSFARLRELTQRGWEIVGEFLKLPEVDPKAGLWVLRRPRKRPTTDK